MMPSQSLAEIFEDCVNRIAMGQSSEACLALYPDYAARLRPMLEDVESLRAMRIPQNELLEDQALVWQQIIQTVPRTTPRRGRGYQIGLLAAILLLLFLITVTWFVLNRPDLPSEDGNVVDTLTKTSTSVLSVTPSVTYSPTPTMTQSVTPTASAAYTRTTTSTLTLAPTEQVTNTPTSPPTKTPTTVQPPTATFAPGCGAPLTEQDAIDKVLEIYPNTTVTSITQQIRFGNTLVWQIRTSHQIELTIDVACGVILTIERPGDDGPNQNSNDNTNGNTNDNQNVNDNQSFDDNRNTNNNQNTNDNSSDDNSGMGSDDSSNDNSGSGGMGSDD